jgi:hypothetical protein
VTPGNYTYASITVNAAGQITAASNGSTSLGGDLSGTLGTASVVGIRGRAVASTAPTDGQSLVYNSANSQWQPSTAVIAGTGVKTDFLTYNSASNDTSPIHIKNNIKVTDSAMYRFAIQGYNYGAGGVINSDVAGYAFAGGIFQPAVDNYASGATLTQYVSSDGYVVLRLSSSSFFYVGLSVSGYFQNPTGDVNVSATVYRQVGNL